MSREARKDSELARRKRRAILGAASRVFAQRGYSGTRVGDIAKEAGVAYGLVYHYFRNKDDVLHSLFEENWSVALKVIEDVHAQGGSLVEKLRSIAGFFLEAWRMDPDLVQVLMVEVVRSSRSLEEDKLQALTRSFELLEIMFEEHRLRGDLRSGVDPKIAGFLFIGSLEMLLTGFVARELLAEEDEQVARCRDALVDNFLLGVATPT